MGQCQFDFPPLFEDKHKKEVVAMAVSEDLLVSVSKDQDLVIWSTRSKVPPPLARSCSLATLLCRCACPGCSWPPPPTA